MPASESEIYIAIKDAIIDQRLRPNMQLVEEDIAESFGVSRTPVRNVFRRLAAEKLVSVVPYKGTFVWCPTVSESKEVFEMRRVLEEAAVRRICRRLDEQDRQQLARMLEEELEANERGDLFRALRISGDFHLRIAQMAGNSYYSKYLEELISLSYVIIAFYGGKKPTRCDHHKQILNAIERGDGQTAAELMTLHLKEVEDGIDYGGLWETPSTMADIFKLKLV
ncbi:GntR family transcriptional regulator [Paenibacillus sp. P96]|uniref:GntR family transcriptional regulator n=1 Tax=Paenibacillus zeirhizosphaerae TaxID=2987519 RepID=A0ABT9FX05_9BACL|nr:GntR family transcriptional regulator [Paenibacillus sp. P96]MDP4099258.1 GntR family transcriptional regulator [Paenibacillus sp. P96]